MPGVGTVRRYCLLKEQAAAQCRDEEIALTWRGKRQSEPGTPLPAGFPALAELAALRPPYTAVEDLLGPTPEQSADVEELATAGLPRKLARAVIAALTEL
ncbi:hypothetical protein [Sorangium sp. So ce1024]|uniref:hypothetical protein n=1 Tax=Sorangium sp. So ce1024 TaxID=3133327 RepID=UPI003F0F4C91